MRASTRRALALAGAVAATGMTVLWVVVVPERAGTTTGVQALAIRWGHPASWALLAALGLAVAADVHRRVREVLAWGALGSYAVFVLALLL